MGCVVDFSIHTRTKKKWRKEPVRHVLCQTPSSTLTDCRNFIHSFRSSTAAFLIWKKSGNPSQKIIVQFKNNWRVEVLSSFVQFIPYFFFLIIAQCKLNCDWCSLPPPASFLFGKGGNPTCTARHASFYGLDVIFYAPLFELMWLHTMLWISALDMNGALFLF